MGVTHGANGEIDNDPEGVEQHIDNGLVRPLRGRNPFILPIRGLPPTAIQILPLRGMNHPAKLLNSTAVHPSPLP